MKKLTLRDITPEERERFAVAVHEAGHAVIAAIHGDTVGSVTLTPDHPRHAGNCALATEQFSGANHARIAYAGPYAEAFWRHGGPPTSNTLRRVLTASGREDDKIVRASGQHPTEVPRLVSNCWASITGLARHLFIHGAATAADVDRALFLPEHDDPQTRGHALSMIRSGSAPGSFTIKPVGSRS